MAGQSRGAQSVTISACFVVIASITVLLRLWTRFRIVHCAGLEDYFIALAMICSIGLTVCIGLQAHFGMGQHIWTLKEGEMQSSLKAFWASLIVYYLSLGLTKSSILLQYLRVFPTRQFRIACYAIMAVVVCYTVWTIFGSIFACVPVHAFWTKEPGARCIDQFAMWFTNAGINIVTDFAIILLPMPVIRSLNLAQRQKLALMAVFAVGGVVCIVSILRLHSLIAISNSSDPTYDNAPAATWSSVEASIGITCSCLPTLRPLISRTFPSFFPSYARYGRQSTGGLYGRNTYGRTATTAGRGSVSLGTMKSARSGTEDRDGDRTPDNVAGTNIMVNTIIDVKVEDYDERKDLEQRQDSMEDLVVKNVDRAV